MARLAALSNDQVDPEIRQIFETYEKERGNVPNAFRTLARTPALFKSIIAHYRIVMFEGELDFPFKELLLVRVSQRNQSRYWLAAHVALAGQQGWKQEDLETLRDGGMPEDYDARTRAALEYVAAMAHDAHDVTDEIFASLQEHFSETQILEITAVAAVSSYFNRLTAALRIDLSGSNLPYEEGPL